MSPEQVSGQKATSRSDLYSVGVTLYELLTGTLPITGSNNYEIMMGHMQQVPVPPHQVVPLIPAQLSLAVMRSLEKDPARRFSTAQEFLDALQASAGEPSAAAAFTAPLPMPAQSISRPSTAPIEPKPSSGSGFQSLALEDVSRKLATYIGPVAKFVVKKLAAQSEDLDTIYREAAKQITSETDRAAFLRSKNQ
jgi:serine/threonine-protein kinase